MAGARGNYSDGEVIHGGDLNQDLTTVLGNDYSILLQLLGNTSWVASGFSLASTGPLTISVGSGVCFTNTGVLCAFSGGTVTLSANTTGSDQYTTIYIVSGTANGTNNTTGNPTVSDTSSLATVVGSSVGQTGALSSYCQIGYAKVSANSSTASVVAPVYSPNSQGPLKTFVDLANHVAANITTQVVHGVQTTTAGGVQALRLALTGIRGGTGALEGIWWFPGSGLSSATDGYVVPVTNGPAASDGYFWELNPASDGANTAANLNISGKFSAPLNRLKLYANDVAITGSTLTLNGVPVSTSPTGGLTDSGQVAVSVSGPDGNKHIAVPFHGTFTTVPSIQLTAQVAADPTGGVSYYVLNPTTAGFTLIVNSGTSWSGWINWNASS